DQRLHAAITRPRAADLRAAVLLLPALGARVRTGPLAEASPRDGLAFVMRCWASAGLAVARVDPAGVGESAGPAYEDASLAAELPGPRAALAAGAAIPGVERVFLLGHSLGGALAPLVASESAPAGIIVYGAPGRRWSECLADGARRQLALAGAADG